MYNKPNSAAEQRANTAYGGRNHIVNTQGFYQGPSSSSQLSGAHAQSQYSQQNQGQTKWQKVSNSNHELTKLFY